MTTTKPVIFVSHASEDADRVLCLKKWLDRAFIEALDVFASCDPRSLRGGDEWMERIKECLTSAQVALLFVSRSFLNKPWCYFEAGGAFFRGTRVIPLLYSDVVPESVPFPLVALQGFELARSEHVLRLVHLLAELYMLAPSVTEDDCRALQRTLGIGASPSADADIEARFADYCTGLLASGDIADRAAGIRMLSGLRSEYAISRLIEAFSDDNADVRQAAATTIEKISRGESMTLVSAFLNQLPLMSYEAAGDAAEWIGRFGRTDDLDEIAEMLADCDDGALSEFLRNAKDRIVARDAEERKLHADAQMLVCYSPY